MGKLLHDQFPEAKSVFEEANQILDWDIRDRIFNGSEDQLKQTNVTQPAIFTVSCAAFRVFSSRLPSTSVQIVSAAGHSLGEYSALFAAQVFDFKTGLKLVEYRGQFIQEACRKNPGSMAAMIGFERDQLQKLCSESQEGGEVCEMVNFNCPGQIVVAGSKKGIEALAAKAASVPGTKTVLLNVSGAFHSSLMKEAAGWMKGSLEKTALKDAWVPVFTNCDAKPTSSGAEIKEKLVRQIDHPVLWEDSIQAMAAQGVETFVEIGPGKVLTGLLRKIDRKIKVLNVEDPDSLAKTLQGLETAEVKTS